jgi:hypothetical protein
MFTLIFKILLATWVCIASGAFGLLLGSCYDKSRDYGKCSDLPSNIGIGIGLLIGTLISYLFLF